MTYTWQGIAPIKDVKADRCPACGARVTYRGFTSVECSGPGCVNYVAPAPGALAARREFDYDFACRIESSGANLEMETWLPISRAWMAYLPSVYYPAAFVPERWRLVSETFDYTAANALHGAGVGVQLHTAGDAWELV